MLDKKELLEKHRPGKGDCVAQAVITYLHFAVKRSTVRFWASNGRMVYMRCHIADKRYKCGYRQVDFCTGASNDTYEILIGKCLSMLERVPGNVIFICEENRGNKV